MAYRSHTALVYNLAGQELEFYPPPAELLAGGAPPAAATYRVFAGSQSNDDTPRFTGTASLDATSTTTDAASGVSVAQRNRVYLTATTNVVAGRRYLLTATAATGGHRLVIVPRTVQSADSVDHQNDLPVDFASGAAFVGLRHSFTIDPSFIATASNINMRGVSGGRYESDTSTSAPPYRVEWTYTIGGLTRKHWTTFDVCRAPLKHNVTIDHVKAAMPDVVWHEWTQQRGEDYQPQIDEGFERVKMDIRMAGYDPDVVVDPQITDRLTTLAARACITRALDKDVDGFYESKYVEAFQKAIGTGLRAWLSVDSSGAVAQDPARQLWLTR